MRVAGLRVRGSAAWAEAMDFDGRATTAECLRATPLFRLLHTVDGMPACVISSTMTLALPIHREAAG